MPGTKRTPAQRNPRAATSARVARITNVTKSRVVTRPHGEHGEHAGHSPAMFREKFWLSLLLTVPVVLWSEHVEMLLGYEAPDFPGSGWIAPVLGTVVFLYGGLVFLRGAARELKGRLPGMMTLISLAILVAFTFSWIVQLGWLEATAL